MADILLSKENIMWQERARKVAREVVLPKAAHYDRISKYPYEFLNALKEVDMFKVWIPEQYGGAGGERCMNLCLVVEELSRACGGVGVMFAVNALGSFPIILGGTEEQKKKWLPKIAKGETLMAYCLSEKGSGSDAMSMRMFGQKDGSHYVLNGEKKWTTNGGAASLYTVFAVTDTKSKTRRISGILVEKGTPGMYFKKIEDKMGIRCVPVIEVLFKDCKVAAENLLGGQEGYGFKHAMATLDCARPGVAAQAIGLAQGAIDLALYYTARRKQFGNLISSMQYVQFRLAELAARVEAARRLVYAAAQALDRGSTDVTKLSAMSKLVATETAMEVTTYCVQAFGGYGFMKDYPIEKYMRDAKITQIYEGANEVQRLVIARQIYKEAQADLGFLSAVVPAEKQYVHKVDGLEQPDYFSVPGHNDLTPDQLKSFTEF